MSDQKKIVDVGRRDFIVASTSTAIIFGSGISMPRSSVAATSGKVKAANYGPYPTEGMAVFTPSGLHKLLKFNRRALGPKDVAIKLHYCGICHSDIHTARQDWGQVQYPLITGHELAGEVIAIGSAVTKHKIGDRVGLGCLVNSCRTCDECRSGLEQYCESGLVGTYASKDRDGTITQGGYSKLTVVDEDFVLQVPAAIDLAHAGPMMCAGITVYSPLRKWNVSAGQKVAIIGFGGLGHMASQIAKTLGADVTVFTTSPEKVSDAKRLGAKAVVVYKDETDLSKYRRAFHFILDTVPYAHRMDRFFNTLKLDGTLCRVGVGKTTTPIEINQISLVQPRRNFASSMVGGIRETQELIDFCAKHGIRPEITKIPINKIDDAWEKVVAKKARYRFVIDMKS